PRPLKAEVPAFLPFPDHAAVLLKAKDAGRAESVRVLQAMMLRFLTGLPPGKVRFTIFDPVGRGENFASFMHLADSDELLVTSRIWTEPGQIETRLTDLTEHMENVIQKYLRNQYKSIEEYNRAAGEVAEPYRVLVVANFPTHFTPDAAKRLVSVMSSGPACGVCTLVGVDTAAALPRDFRLSDLEQVAFTLNWKDGRFVPKDGTFTPFPLTIDAPPPPTEVAKIVRRIGEASKTAGRVEVPFSYIAPPADQIWKGSTTRGIEVPIGRAGATRRQVFALGQGTAQHALVAGKTGSGKSTLLHALITNLALIYSPDEAELYLIDFKKGVEFKLYAEHQLPHARVVAIESEREFGLSVLQRLDGILRERGEEFRRAGVNDVAGFREARPGVKLPRILLVVDEFQEFFVEDDKLSQEAALLLDRLVRQGRAFGVHVLLGSQTLGGAFSLARSTIDQMAVRIALQCSEADAQLILSKENTAARLLTRPGEAIYNDANGLTEGNDPFQVVWLDEGERERVVDDLHRRAPAGAYPPPLVFEGSAAGDLTANKRLNRLLEALPEQVAEFGPPALWLGDPVAIKDPTAAVFRPQSASNRLMVGQSDEAALGVFSAGLVTLAARLRPTSDTRSILLLDGTPDDSDFADHLRGVCRTLRLESGIVERHHLPAVLGELAAEIDRRNKGESADRSPRFLLVNGLQRFRELRKADDDFSFGRRGEKTISPGELFATVLRDGPSVGVHTVVWCDSVTNLNRAFERATLREFAMRALFQMNPNDSSQLIDSPAASRLGRNRALYIEDGSERPEKFRPYGLCELDWVRRVGEQLGLRVANGSVQDDATAVPMSDDAVPERV
ncbi:MAG: FtsK/SpoIIIE domain-containing protein, partial [Gemmataceae bacterium]